MSTLYDEKIQELKKQYSALMKRIGARKALRRRLSNPRPQKLVPSNWGNLDAILAPIQWDWPGWLPRGFLTILVSEPGAGKSLLALHLTATYLRHTPWPDGAPFAARDAAADAAVVWCESESSHALNLQRARRWDLDLSRILSPLTSPLHNFNLSDLAHTNALIALARRPEVRLIVLDSLRGLRSGPNTLPLSHNLRFLADLARIGRIPVLLTHHLRKRITYNHAGDLTLDQILGAGAVTQVPRVIWAIDRPDPADPGHRRLATIKNNLALRPDPLGFHLREDRPHFGPAPQPPGSPSELDRAVAFLQQQLAAGPLPANKMTTLSQDAGLSKRTVRRAKRRLGVRSFRPDGKTEWHWELPPEK